MRFFSEKLSNGLTIIGEQLESASSVAFGFFVRTGARDEPAKVAGVSHFLEHMMFKGTATRSALDVTFQLGAIGAQANAFTSEENTVFYMAVLPEYFREGFELLSDMMRPSLDPSEFDTEKKVILEEIALYRDRPTHMLFEAALREYFSNHPAGNSVLGTTETVGALSREQMKQYFDARYTAASTVLAASGNFDWPQFVEMAKEYCGSWPSNKIERVYPAGFKSTTEKTLRRENLQVAHACMISEGPSAQDDSRYAANVLSCILGDSSGSRAFWALVDKGLADSAVVDADEMDRTGLIYGYVSAAPEKIDEVSGILQQILATPAEFTDDDLQRAKTKIGTRLVLQGERVMRRLMTVGLEWAYREDYSTLQDELERTKQVSRAEIEALLKRYSLKPKTIVRMLPAV